VLERTRRGWGDAHLKSRYQREYRLFSSPDLPSGTYAFTFTEKASPRVSAADHWCKSGRTATVNAKLLTKPGGSGSQTVHSRTDTVLNETTRLRIAVGCRISNRSAGHGLYTHLRRFNRLRQPRTFLSVFQGSNEGGDQGIVANGQRGYHNLFSLHGRECEQLI